MKIHLPFDLRGFVKLSFERIGNIKANLQLFNDHVFVTDEDCMLVKLP
jgi:hypothetical protein